MTTTRLTEALANEQLALLEQRLRSSAAQILQISEQATVIDACVAFAELANTYHPRRFLTLSPPLADRAQRAYQRMHAALEQFIAEIPERPTRRFDTRPGEREEG